ncbi:MAG: HAD hydrolase-like protein [Ruminococcaceae bacterium]|nr:HAD hydrolase-like protein [Oscillospiraceae bacterium]
MKQSLNVKCVIFDLDDTLYPQIEFDLGCLEEASRYISSLCGIHQSEIFCILTKIITEKGIEYRKIFDDLFIEIKFDGMCHIKEILKYYWSASPQISLFPNTDYILDCLKKKYLLAMITDGYVNVQKYKINKLSLNNYFDNIYFTDSYGIKNRKPSKYVFDIFLKETKLSPKECVYIGNDPRKDFLPARSVGMHTIRIRQGSFSEMTLNEEYEADYTIQNISQLINIL